jgi:hypothetical protein
LAAAGPWLASQSGITPSGDRASDVEDVFDREGHLAQPPPRRAVDLDAAVRHEGTKWILHLSYPATIGRPTLRVKGRSAG